MFERGDWITPSLGGQPWFEKPALLYWLQIGAYHLVGINEFAARLGPALCGLGTVASLCIFGRHLDSQPEKARRYDYANWFGVVAASTLGILVFAHGASFDIVITFALTAAMTSFFIYDRSRTWTALVGFYVFIGLSLLAKGLIGILFPFAIAGFYFVLSRRMPDRRFVVSLFWGTAVSLLVAGLWYVPAYTRNGWEFIDEFVIQHHFARFFSNKYQHPQPFYFFLWVLPLMTLPWLPFIAAEVIARGKQMWRRRSRAGVHSDPESNAIANLAIAWMSVPLVFFSLSGSKLPGYILPAVPGAVLLAALFVTPRLQQRAWRMTSLLVAAITLIGVIIVSFTILPRFMKAESVQPLVAAVNSRGFTAERIFAVHCNPHGTEFYAPDRILRGPDGVQKKLYSGFELKTEMERIRVTRVLVIVPADYPDDITVHKFFRTERLATNGELAIYAVDLLGSTSETVH
jgi:4-amino-4-deoxy-L-arabinose transferase-like glycosyltransferase